MRARFATVITGAGLLALCGSFTAQSAPLAAPVVTPVTPQQAPPSPGAVQSTLPTKPVKPKSKPAPAVETPSSPQPGVSPGGPAVLVQHFQITGNTVFDDATLQALLTPWVGKRQTLLQLYGAADKLTAYYRQHGYGLAYVSLPAQTLKNGTVRLQVVEGRLGNIAIQGNDRTGNATLIKRVSNLHTGDVYATAAMERAVLLLNDLPGMHASAVLSPGQQFGTSDVLFKVKETPYNGDVSIDDYGRSVIGRWRLNADVNVNSVTGHGDELSAGITHTSGNLLNFGKLAYSLPLGPPGGTLNVAWNRAVFRVGGSLFGSSNISGSTENGSLNYMYAQVRTRDASFYWGFGGTHNSTEEKTPTSLLARTNINLLQFTTFYTRDYPDYSYYTLAGNLWTNGKHYDSTQINTTSERLRVQLDGSYVQPFANLWRFIASGSGAYSVDPLVDPDKFSLGGPSNVRGFPPAEVRGDRGVFASLEVQRIFAIGELPMAIGGFIDSGKVWNLAYGTTASDKASITSVGTEWLMGPSSGSWNMRLQLAWAVGGTRPSDGNNGGHIWFTFGTRF